MEKPTLATLIIRRLMLWATLSSALALCFAVMAVFLRLPSVVVLWAVAATAVSCLRWVLLLPLYKKIRARLAGNELVAARRLSALFALTDALLVMAGTSSFISTQLYQPATAAQFFLGIIAMGTATYLLTPVSLVIQLSAVLLAAMMPLALGVASWDMSLILLLGLGVTVVIALSGFRHTLLAGLSRNPETNEPRQIAGEEKASGREVDSLTGLPNRPQMMSEIERAISRSQRHGGYGALIFVDLDYFKEINDTQGHDVGDQVLREFASRLRAAVRVQDMVARFGGDEFVVLLESLGSDRAEAQQNVQVVADKMLSVGQSLWQVAGVSYDLDLSGGIVLFDGSSTTASELLKSADLAMYEVKQSGRRGVGFYDSALAQQAEHRLELLNSLRQGLQRNEFELYFQPIVDAKGNIAFAESLLRWNRGVDRVMSARSFMDVMANSPMINQVGYWVIRQACQHINNLRARGNWHKGAAVFINVSGKQLGDAHFATKMFELLDEFGVEPQALVIEIAEDAVINKRSETMNQLKTLKSGGIGIALDDFGVGYSSLNLLQDVGADFVKLDNVLVGRLTADEHHQVTRTVIDLCKTMGLKVIAEGVEHYSQFENLKRFGCDFFQGYHFYHPMQGSRFYTEFNGDSLASDNTGGLRLVK